MRVPVWVEHTGENVVGYACAGALATLPSGAGTISWTHLLTGAGVGALTALLASGAALRVDNGTDSFNPRVVAKPHV